MEEIKLHRWESAFQTVASYQEQYGQDEEKTCFRLFFGKEDHWVDNELRDAFLYKYCDDAGPKAFGKHNLDIQAQIDPSADGDETSIMIPHDFSIRKFFTYTTLFDISKEGTPHKERIFGADLHGIYRT